MTEENQKDTLDILIDFVFRIYFWHTKGGLKSQIFRVSITTAVTLTILNSLIKENVFWYFYISLISLLFVALLWGATILKVMEVMGLVELSDGQEMVRKIWGFITGGMESIEELFDWIDWQRAYI